MARKGSPLISFEIQFDFVFRAVTAGFYKNFPQLTDYYILHRFCYIQRNNEDKDEVKKKKSKKKIIKCMKTVANFIHFHCQLFVYCMHKQRTEEKKTQQTVRVRNNE